MKAVLKNGLIHPNEPLPDEWTEGTELDVERSYSLTEGDALDQWFAELQALAAQGDPEDDKRLEAAIREVCQQEKERARQEAVAVQNEDNGKRRSQW